MNLRDALRVPSAEVTDESVWQARRHLVAGLACLPAVGLAGCAGAEPPPPPRGPAPSPDQVRAGFSTDEELTRWEDVTTYNNFYEFGSGKSDPSRAPRTLRTSPWQVEVGGECARPGVVDFDELLRGLLPEERIYRLVGWTCARKREDA